MSVLAAAASSPDPDQSCLRRPGIVAAASQLLTEGGLDGLTIRAVLKRTGLARRAFYESFAGKDDLVLAVFDETLADAAAHFSRLVAPLRSPIDQIRLIVDGLVLGALGGAPGFGGKHVSAIIHEHLRLAQSRPTELQTALRPLLGVIADLIAAGVAAGQLRACDPVVQATLIYNLVATTLHTELLMEELGEAASDRRQRLAAELWEFCRRAIVV